ncbi:hemerythrin domain-containing protein [Ferruginivarius sediminum]|uniref:Hemerythrin-like domain-containing protein n=1 Tax=Ferruginivarius sediminum TaxID=2661937 RepID=A0A369TES8_9PROT|nr:hemerythrin domain-containing protein [Ferruginivarius sediminum]RDD63760.1 hypothetical protein DRB17_00865 [Ferruginivarius sediminum]
MAEIDSRLEQIPWVDAFNVGQAEIDLEHRHLFDEINRFVDHVLSKEANKTTLDTLITRMISNHKFHFIHEEQIMLRYNYSQLPAHAIEHRNLEARINEIYGEFTFTSPNNLDGLLDQSLTIKELILDHFLHYDLKYKSHLMNAQGR